MNKSTNPTSRALLVALVALGSSLAAFAPSASAMLMVEESFSYDPGVLGLVNGGMGFNTEFRSGGGNAPASWDVGSIVPRYTIVPGLTYAGLTSSGGALQLLDQPQSDWNANLKRSFTTIDTTTTQVWGSYLFRLDEIIGNGFAELKLGQPTNLDASLTMAVNASENSLLSSNVLAGEQTGPILGLGETTLIVWAYNNHADVGDFNVGELLYWINPTLGVTPSVASAAIMLNAGNSSSLGTMQIYGRLTDFVIDEIRIGTSFASVTPIPEASSFAALAGAFGLLAAMTKRRRRTG